MSYMELLTGEARKPETPSQSYMDLLTNGPSLTAPAPGTRVPSEIVQDVSDKGANAGAAFMSSLPPDDAGKIQMLSKQMGIPVQRFGVMSGNIVYVGDDGKTYRAIPSVSGASGPVDALKRAGTWLASQFGPNVPGLVGGVAGIATAPVAGGIPGATAAAGATDVARQAVANYALGRDVGNIDWANVGGQAALAGAGQGVAAGIGRLASRNPMQIAPYDRAKALDPATLARAQAAQDTARSAGMEPLTFGQATGLRSALAAERQLARDPVSMDTMASKYTAQRAGIGRGVSRFLDDISGVGSTERGAEMLREGAGKAVDFAVSERRRVAAPLYERVMGEQVDAPAMAAALSKSPIIPDILDKLRKSKVYAPELDGLPDNSLRLLDMAKRELDDMHKAAKMAGRTNEARMIAAQRDSFVSALDDATRDAQTGVSRYAEARAAFAGKSPEVDALRNGPVGVLADRETPNLARDAGVLFDFQRIGPKATAEARAAYERAGQMDQWNAGLRAHVQNMFAAADGSAQKFINRVWGSEANSRERDVLKAAMTPAQWQGFRTLMQSVEHIAKTLPEGSPTATDAMGGRVLREQFGGSARMVGRALSPLRAADAGGAATDAVALRLADKGMLRLAEAVTDPNNVDALKKLRMMNPRSEKAVALATQIMGGSLVGLFGGRTPDEMTPPVLDATQPNRR